jgi:serine protease AprX
MTKPCPLCRAPTPTSVLAEAAWMDPATERALQGRHPSWRRQDGACPACVQQALLTLLLEKGERVLGRVIQDVWPLDAEAAFGALPTPLRMRADPRFTGRGVTIAVVDAGFHPHRDLVTPANRIRAWADASSDDVEARQFSEHETPRWSGSDESLSSQWHGLMTAAAAVGNGASSHGLYRGMAPDAELVLVQVRGADGRIGGARVARGLRWIHANRERLGVRVVNVSLGVADVSSETGNDIDDAVAALVADGVSVVVAAGNDGVRHLAAPATSPDALTVGGLDDRNMFDAATRALWHSNYGDARGWDKPDLVAPSTWVVAPILPGTDVAREALALFERRRAGDATAEPRIAALRLVTPHYQHVEGTSFASPIVSGVIACMLEANPSLTPKRVRDLLVSACEEVAGATRDRQGAGALDAGRAVAFAVADVHGVRADPPRSPVLEGAVATFVLHDHRARSVRVLGSWDGWRDAGSSARQVEHGWWEATVGPLAPGQYTYKLLVDESRWLPDPNNPTREGDGFGGWNSQFTLG